ncbi:hypothetical protein NL317_30585, partial [Klebsiella pneumoniae]|nr:hypothetical protein [Klebsiella pneumoniae]
PARTSHCLPITQRKRPLVAIPTGFVKLLALPFSILPIKPVVTEDQIALLGVDNVVSEEAIKDKRTFRAFNITPTAMDGVLST